MRWLIALIVEFLLKLRWPTKMLLFLVFLLWTSWSSIAGPFIEYYDLLGELHGLDGGWALQGRP